MARPHRPDATAAPSAAATMLAVAALPGWALYAYLYLAYVTAWPAWARTAVAVVGALVFIRQTFAVAAWALHGLAAAQTTDS